MLHKYRQKYSKVVKSLQDKLFDLLRFYDFPKSIHTSIYTTNLIESFNKLLKRSMKKKEQFSTEEGLERFICLICCDYNKRFEGYSHKGFYLLMNE